MPGDDMDDPQRGPSWVLMLLLILLAMLAASAVAWIFIHRMLHPS